MFNISTNVLRAFQKYNKLALSYEHNLYLLSWKNVADIKAISIQFS